MYLMYFLLLNFSFPVLIKCLMCSLHLSNNHTSKFTTKNIITTATNMECRESVLQCQRGKKKTSNQVHLSGTLRVMSSLPNMQTPLTSQWFYNRILPREIFTCFHFGRLNPVKSKNYVHRLIYTF